MREKVHPLVCDSTCRQGADQTKTGQVETPSAAVRSESRRHARLDHQRHDAFVAQSHDIVHATSRAHLGFDVKTFSDDNLFDEAKAKANKCQLRKFVIMETGEEESP